MTSRRPLDLSRKILEARLPLIEEQVATLSERQLEVAGDMIKGLTAEESGRLLGIATKTVRLHRLHVCKIFEARSAVEVTRMLTLAGY